MRWILTAACLLLAVAGSVHADSEVKSLHITSDIKNRYATTQVSCHVVNTADAAAEAPFFVTFPDTAFVTAFAIDVNGREIKAAIKKNEDVIDLDKEFADVMSVFVRDANQFSVVVKLEAKGEVTFKLTYEELLARHLETYANIIHINPQQIVDDLKVTVNIEESTTITDLEVLKFHGFRDVLSGDSEDDSELAKIVEKGPKSKEVVWAPTPDQQRAINAKGIQGQLVVKYDVDRLKEAQPYLVDEGYYFTNYFAIDALPSLKKHIIFVLDYSYSSMEGQKLDDLKQAMGKILPDLHSKDYFSIVTIQSFAEVWSPNTLYRLGPDGQEDYDREHMLKSEHNLTQTLSPEFLVEASPANIELAQKYLQDTELGGSFLVGGLKAGLDLAGIGANQWKAESDPPLPLIVFLSDGLPNIGDTDEAAILDQVRALNPNKVPIYSLAFGYYADYDFLRKLSLNNFGSAKKVYQDEDASAQMINYYKFIASPVMTKLSFTYLPTKVVTDELTRHEFPVYYKGSEFVVAGKLIMDAVADNDTIGQLTATMDSSTGSKDHPIPVGHKVAGHFGEKTFAFLWLRQLLDEVDVLPDGDVKSKIEEKAENLALAYSFVTPLTSLLIEKPDGSKSVVEVTPLKQAPPLDKTELKKITWLRASLTDDTAAQVSVTLNDQSYNLALKPSDETFGKCVVQHMVGECHHLQKCALEIFEDDVSVFLPYKCDITGNYLGACCPFHVS